MITRFYFSLRSPYSWLAWRDLTDEHSDLLDRIDLRPFWEPDEQSEKLLQAAGGRFLYTPMSKEKHLYILQDVRRLAAERGLEVAWPIDVDPCWEVPHLAYLLAERHAAGRAFIGAAYRARWQQARDICDPAVVASIASDLGLDPVAFGTAAQDPGLRAAGTERLKQIYQDSVFGVPYFRHGFQRYWGLDRFPQFIDAVRGSDGPARAVRDEPVLVRAAAAVPDATDFGPAGGCG